MKEMNFEKTFTITAHTGCEKTPQNSLVSVDKAFESGADIFEVDIRFDKNGVPVLSHDAPKGGEPTLEEVFVKLSENKNIRCNLDLKCTDNLKEIAVLAKKYDVLDRIFYTGVFEKFVESVKNDTPEIPYFLNLPVLPRKKQTDEYINSLVDKVKESGAMGINCNYRNVTPEIIEAFHKNNLQVSVWTVDKENAMMKFSGMNPDNITTRKPSALKNLFSYDDTVELAGMKPWQKATFIAVLVVFIAASVTISFISMARAPFEYEYQTAINEQEGNEGWVLFGFNGNTQTVDVKVDYVRDEDGNNPDKTKPVSAVGKFTMNTDEYVETIYIGKDVKYIDETSFFYCRKLESFEVDKDNPYYTSVDGVLYTKDMKTLVSYPYNKGGYHKEENEVLPDVMSYTIPEGVERIASCAFYKNNVLTEVKLPSTLKEIGDMAFFKCERISLVTLPDGLLKIGQDTFSYCHGMKPLLYIPASVKEIGNYAFYSCAELKEFYMGAENEDAIILGESWLPKNIEKTVINIAPEAQYGKTRAEAEKVISEFQAEEGGEN